MIELTYNHGMDLTRFITSLVTKITELDESKEWVIQIKPKSKKRSINANDYLWALCDKIAQEMSKDGGEFYTREDIYKDAIREVGVYSDISTNDMDAETEDKVMSLLTGWGKIGIGWFVDEIDVGLYRRYYGSSSYSKNQMSRLIDYIVAQAKSLNIETKTPDEISKMEALWQSQ